MHAAEDLVVLLDAEHRPSGTAPRREVHTTRTPLHLAFSCYLLDEAGRVLLTRRATSKQTFAGVWTNSFCGHPRPHEPMEDAVHRYATRELGTTLRDLRCVLPTFRYRAVDASGIVENEVCPVFVATCDGPLRPNPDEVDALRWVTDTELRDAVAAAPWALSPWMVEQMAELESSGAWGRVAS
ncbi:isopentenyl-diphosphate Delta-isomerase [Aeromicrobium massiliense]|uniref:isopentenyl-diphosphate Delta-isomerase n=1 Tax=Aeromicrobium massiliense TaxID=1464554 RepID=UPI00067484C0|nr:isopentenyl-diphosphate Delta-isomerase [Aeromicrobium massiliense]